MVQGMKKHTSLAERWLWLGVAALAFAGLYALIPVIARTPQLKALGMTQELFDVALVVHVDLSVLIWFFAMLGMGISLVMERHEARWPYWGKAAFAMTALATALITCSPLDTHWEVVKSNYIPVLHNGLFLLSLGILFTGLLLLVIPIIAAHLLTSRLRALQVTDWGWLTAALILLLALAGYYLSAQDLPPGLLPAEHYEALFWAGGHIMQFSFVAIVMTAWLVLLEAIGARDPSRRWALLAYLLALIGAVASFAGFVLHPIDTGAFTLYETRIMIELGGLGASLMALLVIGRLVGGRDRTSVRNACVPALVMSLILFFAGGGLGLMIAGQNVTIPAHYHGIIVGITLALMGVAYSVMPKFGYLPVATTRLAFYQPIVYGMGQLMHIGGLAYCGGYGILRKTAGGFGSLTPDVKIALGVFGMGGLLAIIGGILFVVVMLKGRCRASG